MAERKYINLNERVKELVKNPDDFVNQWVELTAVLQYEFDPEQRRNCYWLEFSDVDNEIYSLGLDIDWTKTLTSQVLDEESKYNKFGPTIPREKAWRDKVPIFSSKGKKVDVRGILRGPDEDSSFYYVEPEAIETKYFPLGGWNIIRFKVKTKSRRNS